MIMLASCLLPAAAGAQAQDDLRAPGQGSVLSKVSAYQDDDDTLVITSLVDGDVVLPGRVTLGAHVLVDSISSASVDVVSAATGRWQEDRVEAGARAAARVPGGVDAGLALARSTENDWASWSLEGSLARDLAQKNTRVEVSYGQSTNRVGRAGDPAFERALTARTVEAGVTQVAGPRTVIGAVLTVQVADGFLNSPYRYVTTADGRFALPEAHPGRRVREAVTVRVLRAVGRRACWDTSYRLYADDWGVVSHTLATAVALELGGAWDLRLRARAYRQSAADFYQETYAAPMAFMTADRELATFWDAGGGVKLGWRRGRWVVDGKADGTYYRYLDFARLAGRAALVVELGAGVSW